MTGEKVCFAVVFAAEAMIAWLYFEYLLSRNKSISYLFCSFAMGYAALFIFSLLENTSINAITFCAINYILIKLNYQCSIKTALLHSTILCFAMVGAELIIVLIIGLFGYSFSAYTYNFRVMLVLAILSKLLYLFFSIIGYRIFAPHKHRREEPRLMVLFCVLPLLSALIAITIAYFGMVDGITGNSGIMTMLIIITLLIVNLIFLFLYNYLQKADEEFFALQLSIQKEQADIAYYSALQEQLEKQRILIHDIKKHLGTIDALAKQDGSAEIEAYISELEATFSPSTQIKLCTDPILNLLLLRFQDDCKSQDIQFHCDVRENSSAFMDAPSITTLYGNLLSNAIEAATTSVAKQIELSVTRNDMQSVIVISVINSCDNPPVSDGCSGFHTRKADHLLHGIGLRSIRRVVAKYHGVETMYYSSENRQFHHVIQFPVDQDTYAYKDTIPR